MKRTVLSLALQSTWFGVFLCAISHGAETCPANSSGPSICVDWDQAGTPLLGVHFSVDYATDPVNPAVTLHSGAAWNVRSRNSDGSTGNLGDIKIDATVSTDNFSAKIANGANPGAVNLKSAVLVDATNWTGHSSISSGSRITGNLTGDLQVVASGGSGGELSLTIDGDCIGNITAPTVSTLTINGDLSGDISITGALSNDLTVGGNVASTATITMADAADEATITLNEFTDPLTLQFAGDLILQSGIKGGQFVRIQGEFTSDASLDLNGGGVAGTLAICGGAGHVLNVGNVSGFILLAKLADFAGNATFAGVAPSAAIRTENAGLSGLIDIVGDMNGSIQVTHADVMPGGTVHVGGDLNGTVEVGENLQGLRGDLAGQIDIEGGLLGEILVNRDITGSVTVAGPVDGQIIAHYGAFGGDITGDVSIVGRWNGNICGDNLDSELPLPPNIDIQDPGCAYTVCGVREAVFGSADGCRYLKVTPATGGTPVAIEVIKDCGGAAPMQNCVTRYVQSDPDPDVHGTLGTQADSELPEVWGTVYVRGAEITPEN